MAKNDTILLDGIIDDLVDQKKPSDRRDEVFEYLSFAQILKDYDLSPDEINLGSVDGENDGGIDGFFVFVNGHLLSDETSFTWPKAGCEIDVWIINCKHHDTFIQAPLDKLNASFQELLDFSLNKEDFNGNYSDAVLKKRSELISAYRKLATKLNKFHINYVYASRGDTTSIGKPIQARASQLKELTKSFFSHCETSFDFVGSSELIDLYRQRPVFSLELPFVQNLSRGENYIILTQLNDYFHFVSDDNKKLRRYLFDSNVRDFMGLNRVNEDIRETLTNQQTPDFWWLNNGITILASAASIIGQSIKLCDIQIVNGLQTTESIYRHFSNGGQDENNRAVLVKVIVTNDETSRDAIIRSTNNQTNVELASLHATDKIQRDIEEVLSRYGLYYERRKNFYLNQGHSSSEIVTPLYLAAGFITLSLKNPQKASALKSKFMRVEESYNKVFSERTPILLWPIIGHLFKRIDIALEKKRPVKGLGEHFLKKWRYISAFCVVSRFFGTFDYNRNNLKDLDLTVFSEIYIDEVVNVIFSSKKTGSASSKQRTKAPDYKSTCQKVANHFAIDGLITWLQSGRIPLYNQASEAFEPEVLEKTDITQDFIDQVDNLLPKQPWKPGIHRAIMEKLNCSKKEYFAATYQLIKTGRRYKQKDGVLYNQEGEVISYDADRVDPDTLKLIM